KYGFWGLMIFVAIPLPGTGAYSGSIAALILGMNKVKAFISISLGVIIAGIIVALLTTGAVKLF
ncbi:MAG: small multi-drug export protein, partial [Bacteroidales bacterium]|nr:small multi-drug export protein [Bacteroidales bacterium]